MDNFTVGDRCLVHRLESEAGQPLNGQHVTLADAIIQKGRFKCKFDDGSFACIKLCNLQIIHDDRVNQTTNMYEIDPSSKMNQKEDQTKMEVTTDNDKKETTTTSKTTTQPQDEKEEPPPTTHQQQQKGEEKEECSICLDVLPIDTSKFARAVCCGKGMHIKCREDMCSSKMSLEQKNRCVMCRTEYTDGSKEGRKESVKRLRKWVKRGKAWAQAILGGMYRDGKGVKKDEKRAVVLYNLASEQGDAGAQYNLGCMYRDGRGVDKNEKRAVELYTLAVEKGLAYAQDGLGVMYDCGRGVDKDQERAVELYTLASEQGNSGAQYNLGSMYVNGEGVDQSFTKAREWWTKSALQEHKQAIDALKTLNKMEGRTTTPSSTVNSNTIFCSYCNKPEPTNTKFNRCQRCRSVFYCNRECQIKHWKTKPNGHKKQCKKLAAASKTLNKKKEK